MSAPTGADLGQILDEAFRHLAAGFQAHDAEPGPAGPGSAS
ncbi:hypothetical protein ACWCQN_42825 [Streptomyces sp. NPDC001984]